MSSRTSFLRAILDSSNRTQSTLQKLTTNPPVDHSPPSPSPPPFELPSITDITPQLVSAGVSPVAAISLREGHERRANALRKCISTRLHHTWHRIAQTPDRCPPATLRRVVDSFSTTYHKHLESWTTSVVARASSRKVLKNKPAFNTKYVPLLEKYFKTNAYPSPCDRRALANQTGLTLRQIDVWFQNHRNRARNNGQTLNRPNSTRARSSEHLQSDSDDSPKGSPPVVIVEDNQQSTNPPPIHPASPPEHNILDPPAPKHAFPRKFPPECDYEPFPESPLYESPTSYWQRQPRKPASARTPRCTIDVCMDDFGHKFHDKLKIWGSPNDRRSTPDPAQAHSSWYSATQVKLCSGRHPAFVLAQRDTASCHTQDDLTAPLDNIFPVQDLHPRSSSIKRRSPDTPPRPLKRSRQDSTSQSSKFHPITLSQTSKRPHPSDTPSPPSKRPRLETAAQQPYQSLPRLRCSSSSSCSSIASTLLLTPESSPLLPTLALEDAPYPATMKEPHLYLSMSHPKESWSVSGFDAYIGPFIGFHASDS